LRVRVSDRYCPTPTLCWSVAHDDDAIAGVMLTASHNPAPYLGFKLRMDDGGASPVSFTERVEAELVDEPPTARGTFETVDMMGPYLASLAAMVDAEAIRGAKLRVAVDPLYGAGQGYLAGMLRSFGVDVAEVHHELNPGFGGLHPEPIPPHIDEVRELVRTQGLDAAFITDGDADRIGAADRTGAFVNPHRIICLVARHLVEDKGMTGRIVKTLSTSVLVDRLASRLGLEVVTTPVGFKWIYEEMVRGDVLIGGEESGGIGIPSHVRERDGLLMAMMLAEMMAQRGMGLGELVDDLLALTGPMEYRRLDLRLDASVKEAFVAAMPAMAPAEIADLPVGDILRVDGIKFLLPDDAWLLMRTSGTEPLVRIYAEASSAGVVDDLLAAGSALVLGA
jgi:phosphomannomutase